MNIRPGPIFRGWRSRLDLVSSIARSLPRFFLGSPFISQVPEINGPRETKKAHNQPQQRSPTHNRIPLHQPPTAKAPKLIRKADISVCQFRGPLQSPGSTGHGARKPNEPVGWKACPTRDPGRRSLYYLTREPYRKARGWERAY